MTQRAVHGRHHPELTTLFVIILPRIDLSIVGRHTDLRNHQIVLLLIGRMRTQNHLLNRVIVPLGSKVTFKGRVSYQPTFPITERAYISLLGSHCTVRLGHSKACVITKSYRKGEFFFQILYSSLIIFSSTSLLSVGEAAASVMSLESLSRSLPRGKDPDWPTRT